ncbi:MAG TPA: hypothetical protein VNF73_05555 [Candidatus Saccharimonadales bacterium]|nr:hypothetical protein [Candidatus Saccharimonadales bacterium]
MKVFLLYRDRDVELGGGSPPNAADLIQDLELDILFGAMAAGDRFLLDVVRSGVLASLDDPAAIDYRQGVLADCLAQPAAMREVYDIAVEAIEREKRIWGGVLTRYPVSLLNRSIDVLELFIGLLKRLRRVADEHAASFQSDGFTRFFAMIATELDDEYLRVVGEHLERLRFRGGVLLSAELGGGNRGRRYVLRRPREMKPSWRERLGFPDHSEYVYEVPDRDEAGYAALEALRGRGIALAARALAQSTDHILSFFRMLRAEVGFYVGCLNLHEQLAQKGEPTCLPELAQTRVVGLSARGLYDVCLSLSIDPRVIGNDVMADQKSLVMITGANRGGKSTFLRSIGLAQLMLQCGMFVPAESFQADVRRGIFTHFKREEDASLRSGKLDEELSRMSSIVDGLTPHSLVLLNESFASTNEREGSEIARQIVRALVESGVKVIYVTHMFDLAHGFYDQKMATALFLRAERQADGVRTFRLGEGEPLPTSFGEDVYRRIFGDVQAAASAKTTEQVA